MSRRDRLARVAETAAALRAAQAVHDNALLDARDAKDRATLEELGRAIRIPRQTVRWRIAAARRNTGRRDPREPGGGGGNDG